MRIVKGLELNGKKLEKLLMRQMCTTTSTISKMVNPRASSIVVNSKTQTQFVAPNLWHFSDSLQAYLWGKDYVRISNSIGNGKFKLLRRDAVDEILDHYRQVSGSSTSDGSDTSPSRHVSPRYILYSKECYTGKRMCLVTLLDHYLTQDDFIILYINWIPEILVVHGKVVKVTDDVIDLPERSAKILTHFSELNKKFIESSTTIRDFEWNGVRVVEKGESLKLLVERSLENPTSCQKCIEELIYTAMYLSNLENSKYKFAVFICGLNYIFNDKDIRIGRTERFSIQSVSIIKMIKSLFTTFWNGFVVATVDQDAEESMRGEHYSNCRQILGEYAFQFLDPIIPIEVKRLTECEFKNLYDHYVAINWIATKRARSKEGYEQLKLISGMNVGEFEKYCKSL